MFFTRLLAIVFVVVSAAAALPHDTNKIPSSDPASRNAQSQLKWLSLPISSKLNGLKYTVNLTIGSNYQPVILQLDTTSSDLWVNPDCEYTSFEEKQKTPKELHAEEEAQCLHAPRYRADKSASAKNLTQSFAIDKDSSFVYGSRISDDIRVGGRTITKQQLGVAKGSFGLSYGILGLGPSTITLNKTAGPRSPTMLERLTEQGNIGRKAFSLSLRSADTNCALILGGIDTKKYKGNLQKFPLDVEAYTIPLSAIGQTFPDGLRTTYSGLTWKYGTSSTISVLLDTSMPFVALPEHLVYQIGYTYPSSKFDERTRRFTVPCNPANGSIDFTFGLGRASKTIRVPYSDFIYKLDVEKDGNREQICFLGMIIGSDHSIVLGNSFLRGVYAVFDISAGEVWIGEADDCGERIEPICADNGIPLVQGCKGD